MKHQRRQKGEGSIIEYKKGHYRGFLDLGRDPHTKTHQEDLHGYRQKRSHQTNAAIPI